MKHLLTAIALIVLLAGSLLGQPVTARVDGRGVTPAFDGADIHASPHRNNLYLRGGTLRGDRFVLRDATMVDLIARAYKVEPENVLKGPAWLELDHFDILAKAPPATTPNDLNLMLRTLLADRFKLVAHTALVPQPAYVLTAGTRPTLQESDGSGEPGCEFQQPKAGSAPTTVTSVAFLCHNTTMDVFAQFLHMVQRKPVVNSTGLKGTWDFEFHWSTQRQSGTAESSPLSDAVSRLGLKLELKTTPLPAMVVDSVNERPTANSPDLAKILPPLPSESLEVAVIKPSGPKEKHYQFAVTGNIINFQHASPQMLIYFAWEIDKDLIVNQPPWLNQDFYSVTVKAPLETAPRSPGQGSDVDIDDFREMVRSLMADRFKLITHLEDRPSEDAYTLIAANPKMKKANSEGRASCVPSFAADPDNPGSSPLRTITCHNITMAQFADQLLNLEGEFGGYIKTPVFDATGLTGAYDFVLKFTPAGALTRATAPTSTDASGGTDPSGTISLFDAINKQLGLKLEKQKRPVPALVIDHIEEKPTEN